MLTGHRAALVMCVYYILKSKCERSKRKYLYKKYLRYKYLLGVTKLSSGSDTLSESSSEEDDSSSDDDAPLQNNIRKRPLNAQLNRAQPAKRARCDNRPNAPKVDDIEKFGRIVVSALRKMPLQKSKEMQENILNMIKNAEQGSNEDKVGACSSTTKAGAKVEEEIDELDDDFLLYDEEGLSPASSVGVDIKPEPEDSEEEEVGVDLEVSPEDTSDPLQPVIKQEKPDEDLEKKILVTDTEKDDSANG